MSRVILILTVLLILIMPITEHVWTWDGLPLEGHDLELSLLSLLVFFGLVAIGAYRMLRSSLLLLLDRPLWRALLALPVETTPATIDLPPAYLPDLSVPVSLLSLRI